MNRNYFVENEFLKIFRQHIFKEIPPNEMLCVVFIETESEINFKVISSWIWTKIWVENIYYII